jgi:hypothetical protein
MHKICIWQGLLARRMGPNAQVERRAATAVAKQEAPYRRVRSNAGLGPQGRQLCLGPL